MDNQRLFSLRTMPYEEYLQTPEWAEKRLLVLERDGHRCRLCNTGEQLEVHHRTYARRGHEDLNDLTTLCESCHEHFHRKQGQADIMGRTYIAPRTPTSDEHDKVQWEYYLLGLLMHYASLWPYVRGILNESDFLREETRQLYHVLSCAPDPQSIDVPSELAETVERSINRAEDAFVKDDAGLVKEAIQCATRLKRTRILQTQTELTDRLDAAVRDGDQQAVRELSQQLFLTQRELRTIHSATHMQG